MEEFKSTILDDESQRCVEIYVITCKTSGKKYVGQCVSHVLNHGRYRPYGYIRRYNSHVSEAFSQKKKQCTYLNNAIRKYGKEDFEVEHILDCSMDDADNKETEYIRIYNSLFPNGYNIKNGGNTFRHTIYSRKKLSDAVIKYSQDRKYSRFKDVDVSYITDPSRYIRPLRRKGSQYGWYVYISGIKADFGGYNIDLNTSKNMAINFIQTLIKKCNIPY